MGKDIVKAESFAALAPVEGSMDIQSIININMGGAKIDPSMLDKVKVPSGGSLTWEVPTIDGSTEATKELVGVIVGLQDIRTYYATKYDGGNEPPDCSSADGVIGIPKDPEEGLEYGGKCSECPLSARGAGCAQRKLVLLLLQNSILPIVLNAPRTSVWELNKYLMRLAGHRLPVFQVVTSFKLIKEKNAAGIEYAKIAPSFVRVLEEKEAQAAQAMYISLRSVFGHVAQREAGIDTEEAPF